MMAAEGVDEPEDVFVEDTVVRLLNRIGMPLPAWLQSEQSSPQVEVREQEIEKEWAAVTAAVAQDLETMTSRDYLLITYDIGRQHYSAYGQLTLDDGTFQCEVVSDRFLPADAWPIDDAYFLNTGWSAPDRGNPNWSRYQKGSAEAAATVLNALRTGRRCNNPRLLSWSSGVF
ncbi:hypothetical protein E5206_12465 [Arthrobacter sp. PAMC25564]|uniref:TY-Chap domain-containing protein n=1 Tax=Arthrobacter sp. PAMC25564 TaxID=2565366 RepID=UPI0010A1F9A2|nr:hypothetical protein [Arthrobacter sp. PAMC25564]QCB97632.1 hypothetical protein E5206_12465 [Arthrobacter sp. PAMC25564]